MIKNPNTIFPILTFDAADTWDALLQHVSPELDQRGLDRLKRILDGKCQCVVIERHYIDKDYRDTFSHFHSKRFNTPSSRCVRLHFFAAPVTEEEIAAGEAKVQDSYLGYSVIRPTKPNCIGRTLLAHTLRLRPDAHLTICREEAHVLGTRLTVEGFPFISQDADATVCAESALPLLVTVPQHVLAGYGHVSDYAASPPAASSGFVYSSHFNRAFVVSDDNHFPYQMLHQNGQGNVRDSRFRWDEIEEFIVPLPEKVFLTAEQAQTAIEAVLRSSKTGIAAFSQSLAAKQLVLRLFLTSARSFKRHLRKRGMGNPLVENVYRHLPMPHFVWICELADYSEYAANRRVLGEVIWDATRNAQEPDGWIALHYPEALIVDVGSALNRPQKMKTFALTSNNSYSLFQSNLHTL